MQAPFNPKDWQFALPTSILAVVALMVACVWVAKQLGLTSKQDGVNKLSIAPDSVPSGAQSTAFWENKIDGMLEHRVEPLIIRVEAVERNLREFLVSRDKDWNHLTSDIMSIRQSLHGIRNSLLVMRGHAEVEDD